MKTYDVALWRRVPSLFPDHVEYIDAEGPFLAILQVMSMYRLRRVAAAAARETSVLTIHRYDGLSFSLALEEAGGVQ